MDEYLREHSTQPSFALIFHTRGQAYGPRQDLAALTAHAIKSQGRDKAQIMPGRPLSPEDELSILQMLRPQQARGFSVYPANLLYANGNTTMWWVPSIMAPMSMLDGKGQITMREVVWPALAMMVIGRRLFVTALHSNERPDADAALYFCPTGNVWASTEVCTGNALLPSDMGIDAIEAWTGVFRDSAFTHDNNHGKSIAKGKGKQARSTDPMEFWAGAKHTKFPAEVLVPTGFRLRDWIDFVQAAGAR